MKRIAKIIITLGAALLVIGFGLYARTVVHETVQSRTPNQHYIVALGDSVVAGAGLGNYGHRKPQGCDVSAPAFPFLLGSKLHESVEEFACSGATVAGDSNSLLSAQYAVAHPFLSGSDVVVQAGANDVGWLKVLASCVQTNCATRKSQSEIARKLQPMQQNLTTLLARVQQSQPRHLVVNTYYDLFQSGDTCFASSGITAQETSFIQGEEMQLNAAITAAAHAAKATVVQVDFSGHLLCDTESWIQGVSDNAPLHPTAAGQQQIARQDARVLGN